MGSRAGLDTFEERSHLPMAVIEEQFLGCPVHILGTILYYVIYIHIYIYFIYAAHSTCIVKILHVHRTPTKGCQTSSDLLIWKEEVIIKLLVSNKIYKSLYKFLKVRNQ